MNHYIYEITNIRNGMSYIGVRSCSKSIERDKYMGSGVALKEAISKEGINNFKKSIIQTFDTREQALEAERKIVNKEYVMRKDTYNVREGGQDGSMPDEAKRRISDANKGRTPWNKGIPRTSEERKKMSESMLGSKAWNKGIPRTVEEKKKMSESRLSGEYYSPFKGKTFTEEQLARIKEKVKNQPRSKCIYCGTVTTNSNIKQYHNEKCKKKER